MTSCGKTSNSALHASIESKKDQSYYYAHKPRETGEDPAPAPIHEVLHRAPAEKRDEVEPIFSYQFADGDPIAKVYVPLEGVGDLSEECVESEFAEKSLNLSVKGLKAGKILKLVVRELDGEIVPEECKHRKLANKIVVSLKKKANNEGHVATWKNLKR
ncbi:hypothetical protein BSKO_01409 [Bryopsis sp. KO-2023]|nr:hypothetical protein BSKO_01409 [Bryopsis sp. KO-2023]